MATETAILFLGAAALTVALVLAAMRMAPERTLYRLGTRWRRQSAASSVAIVATLVALSGASLSQVTAPAPVGAQSLDQPDAGLSTTAAGNTEDSNLSDGRAIERLRQYANSIKAKQQLLATSQSQGGGEAAESLPDVDTMIARLAARLEKQPNDVEGWRMLGWSYLRTSKYQKAIEAYRAALALDPKNDEIKTALDEAQTAASGKSSWEAAQSDIDQQAIGPANADGENKPMITAMVERLARRLESSPNDVDGWVRLMRARTVLGEIDQARDALRNALAAFAQDDASRVRLAAAAKEFGLSAY